MLGVAAPDFQTTFPLLHHLTSNFTAVRSVALSAMENGPNQLLPHVGYSPFILRLLYTVSADGDCMDNPQHLVVAHRLVHLSIYSVMRAMQWKV